MRLITLMQSCTIFPSSLLCAVLMATAITPRVSAQYIPTDTETAAKVTENAINQGVEAGKPIAQQALSHAERESLAKSRKLAAEALQHKVQFHDKVLNDQLDPFAYQRELQAETIAAIPNLHDLYQKSLTAQTEQERVELTDALMVALQPVGSFLKPADHRESDHTLTEQEALETNRLAGERWGAFEKLDAEQVPMHFVGTGLTYTLLDIPVPIVLKAKPSSEIYLESTTGGHFSNNLSFIKIKADEQGIARTDWVSHGTVVGDNAIHAISSSWRDGATMHVQVKKLEVRALPTVEEMKSLVQQHRATFESMQKKQQQIIE